MILSAQNLKLKLEYMMSSCNNKPSKPSVDLQGRFFETQSKSQKNTKNGSGTIEYGNTCNVF